jgi:hypothetical protein
MKTLVRIADMCSVTGIESMTAERIKAIIIANPAPKTGEVIYSPPGPSVLINTYCLTSEHITSAANLPDGHPVRYILAAAAVEGYLLRDDQWSQVLKGDARSSQLFGWSS